MQASKDLSLGVSYTPGAPCVSRCNPPDAEHGDVPWCDTKPHRAGWFWRTRSWSACVHAASLREGLGVAVDARLPCRTPCHKGTCLAGDSLQEQDCVSPQKLVSMLRTHMKGVMSSMPSMKDIVPAAAKKLGVVARADGRALQWHKNVARGCEEAMRNLRAVCDALLTLHIEQSIRRPTGRGVSTIVASLQACFDATLHVFRQAEAFYEAPSLDAMAALDAALTLSDNARNGALRAHIEKERGWDVEAMNKALGKLPNAISRFLFSSRGYWCVFGLGVALVLGRMYAGDSFAWSAQLEKANIISRGEQGWFNLDGTGDAIRSMLFLSCMIATDNSSALAVGIRHSVLYRWLMKRILLNRSSATEFRNDARDDELVESVPDKLLRWKGYLVSGVSRVALYVIITKMLDAALRTMCQLSLWLRRDVADLRASGVGVWWGPMSDSIRFWGERPLLSKGTGEEGVDVSNTILSYSGKHAAEPDVMHTAATSSTIMQVCQQLSQGNDSEYASPPDWDVDVPEDLAPVFSSPPPLSAHKEVAASSAAPRAYGFTRLTRLDPPTANTSASNFTDVSVQLVGDSMRQGATVSNHVDGLEPEGVADVLHEVVGDNVLDDTFMDASREWESLFRGAGKGAHPMMSNARNALEAEAHVRNLYLNACTEGVRATLPPTAQWADGASISENLQELGYTRRDIQGALPGIRRNAARVIAETMRKQPHMKRAVANHLAFLSVGDRVAGVRNISQAAGTLAEAAGEAGLDAELARVSAMDIGVDQALRRRKHISPYIQCSVNAAREQLNKVAAIEAMVSDAKKVNEWAWLVQSEEGRKEVAAQVEARVRQKLVEGDGVAQHKLVMNFVRFVESRSISHSAFASDKDRIKAAHLLHDEFFNNGASMEHSVDEMIVRMKNMFQGNPNHTKALSLLQYLRREDRRGIQRILPKASGIMGKLWSMFA